MAKTRGVTVNNGTLNLNKTANLNATGAGNIGVGNGAGATNSATLRLLAANQISNTARVTVVGDGNFDLNGFNETIASFAGIGTINVSSATLVPAVTTPACSVDRSPAPASSGRPALGRSLSTPRSISRVS